jgi:probable phosphoglycerate mutase
MSAPPDDATAAVAGSVVVQADGGSRGNPGPAGYGAVVLDPDTGAVLSERWGYLGRTTNNVAEYSGVIAGLRAAAELGARHVAVRLDSRLIVQQMNGRWKVKHPAITPLADQVRELGRGFQTVTFDWLPRERNRLADALANRAMDQGVAGRAVVEKPGAGPGDSVAVTGEPAVPRSGAVTGDPVTASSAAVTGDPAVTGSTSSEASTEPAPVVADPALLEELGATPRPGAAPRRDAGTAAIATGSARDPAAGEPLPHPAGATRIVIVRHGETTWGAVSRFAGREDVPLTLRGEAEAASVGERVARIGPAVVATSPLQRCRVTAEAIGAVSGVPVVVVEGLTDGALGEWAGFTAAQIAERWPEQFAVWRNDPDARPPGGESFTEVRNRVVPVISDLVRRYRGHTVVIVTHAAVTKMVLVHALGVPSEAAYRLRIDTASVSGLTVEQDGRTVVWAVNEVGHLPE